MTLTVMPATPGSLTVKATLPPPVVARAVFAGPPGRTGDTGLQGAAGASAYALAGGDGVWGNAANWLATLVGPVGPLGPVGPSGASAYAAAGGDALWGNAANWLASLVGPVGPIGPAGPSGTIPLLNLLEDGGRFAGSPEPQGTGASTFAAPAYMLPVNGATFAQGPKYNTNSSTYGGTGLALDPAVQTLVEKLKDPDGANINRRYGVEFFTLQVTAGAGTATSMAVGATTYYMVLSNPAVALPPSLSFNFHVLVQSGSLALMANDGYVSTHVDGTAFAAHQVIQPADGWRQVTRLFSRDPRKFSGYHNIVKRLYATPGTQFVIALPSVTPGLLPMAPGLFYWTMSGVRSWR